MDYYVKLYQETIIPKLSINGLKEQKEMFEGSDFHEDVKIREAIEKRISELEFFILCDN